MLFSSKIAALEGSVASLTQERDNLLVSVSELTQANADCKTRFEADQATILTLTGERDQFKADSERLTLELASAIEAKTKAEGEVESKVSAEVVKRLAHAGVDPIKRDPLAAIDNQSGEKSGLTPRQRLAASINQQLSK